MLKRAHVLALAIAVALTGASAAARATVLTVGNSARINYAPGSFGAGTPPFAFIALGFNFSAANPFGPNESLSYSVFSPTNMALGSGSVSAGNSIYTSGLFAALTVSVFPSTPLNSTSFYAVVTDTAGSFDLIGGQADLYNFAGGTSQFGSVGTLATTPVPEPSTWGMMILGLAGIGLVRARGVGNKATLQA